MNLVKGNYSYSVIRTNDVTSEGTPIFKFAKWNQLGQMVDAGEIFANSMNEVRLILLG